MNKTELRKHYRTLRQDLPEKVRTQAAESIAKILSAQKIFQQHQKFACYCAVGAEVDLQPMINAIWRAQKQCYLPILDSTKKTAPLSFALYQEGDTLVTSSFGIPEPEASALRINLNELEVVLTPLIAFDRMGHRLGTGGGYYDRTFHELAKKPLLIGVGYSMQEANELPSDPWDVPLNGILTEKELSMLTRNN